MQRVFFNQLRSKKQLQKVDCEKVVTAGFTDDNEKCFEIRFDIGGDERVDLSIVFEKETPEIYISSPYQEC